MLLLVVTFGMAGCAPVEKQAEPEKPASLDITVGQLGQLYQNSAAAVKGYGIVAGLAGTGSSECPPELRSALSKYIQQQMGPDAIINSDDFINSRDTAVVEVYGTIPAIASKGDRFDVTVVAFSRTQTTSLAGGTLYTTELKEMSRLVRFDQYSATLAKAQGPIFVDRIEGQTVNANGYVLGGGLVTEEVRLAIGLFKPSYQMSSAIRNRINERFGPDTAKAISPNEIEFIIPLKYKMQKDKFLAMVQLLYLAEDYGIRKKRVEDIVGNLVKDDNKLISEYALEAIGRNAIDTMSPLLKSEDETVSFHAARCMLSIGDDQAVTTLKTIANDKSSQLRVDAIKAIGLNAKRNVATAMLSQLPGDSDFDVKYAAYEQLVRLGDISVSRNVIGGRFFVDQVNVKGPKTIYISRSVVPRVVIFGSPIFCEDNIFVESADKDIVINARPGEKFVSVMRKLPNRPRLVGPLLASYELSDIIQTLCEDTDIEKKPTLRPGLGVPYSDLIAMLEKMCRTGAVKAEFIAGDLTEASEFLNTTESNNQ